MFGRDPIEDLNVMFPSPARKRELLLTSVHVRQLAEKVEQANHFARVNMGLAIARQRRYYKRQPKQFYEQDLVWLFTPTLGARGTLKMHSNWSGPWEITKKKNDLVYEIEATPETGYKGKLVVAIDRLRLYLKAVSYTHLPSPRDKRQSRMPSSA